jgi:hypothetical protein
MQGQSVENGTGSPQDIAVHDAAGAQRAVIHIAPSGGVEISVWGASGRRVEILMDEDGEPDVRLIDE